MKYNILCIFVSLLMTQVALADKPAKCPSVAALAAVGVDVAGEGRDIWMAFPLHRNNYDTNETWSFGLFLPAKSEEEAVKKANEYIHQLVITQGPYHDDDDRDDMWTCEYGLNAQVMGVAFTRPGLTQLFKRYL